MHRTKFNKCLESVVRLNQEMGTLTLLKIWEPRDDSLFMDNRFTANGLKAYWASLDSAFRHWDTFVFVKAKIRGNKLANKNLPGNPGNMVRPVSESGRAKIAADVRRFKGMKSSNKFYWQKKENTSGKFQGHKCNHRCQAPSPPQSSDEDTY